MAAVEDSYSEANVVHSEDCAVCAPFGVRVRALKVKRGGLMLVKIFTIIEGFILIILGFLLGLWLGAWFIQRYMVRTAQASTETYLQATPYYVQPAASVYYEDGTVVLQATDNPQKAGLNE